MSASETGGGATAEVKQFLYHGWNRSEPALGATHFGVSAQVLIGTTDSDPADSFDCILCSPSMFAEVFSVERWGGDGFAADVVPGGEVLPVTGVWLMRSWSPRRSSPPSIGSSGHAARHPTGESSRLASGACCRGSTTTGTIAR